MGHCIQISTNNTEDKISRPRRTHDKQYQCNSNFISTSQFSTSFFPLTISSWNHLPQSTVDIISPDLFKQNQLHQLTQHINYSHQALWLPFHEEGYRDMVYKVQGKQKPVGAYSIVVGITHNVALYRGCSETLCTQEC